MCVNEALNRAGHRVHRGPERQRLGGLDLPDRLGQVLRCRRVVRDARQRRTHVNDDQVSALLGEPQRVCPALAARSSRYQRDLTRDPITHRCHHLLPPVPGPGSARVMVSCL